MRVRYDYPAYEPYTGTLDGASFLVAYAAEVRREAMRRGVRVEMVWRPRSKYFSPFFVRTALYLNGVLCRIYGPCFQRHRERSASLCVDLNINDPRVEVFIVLIATEESDDGRWFYFIPRSALKKSRIYLPFRADHGGFGQNALKRFRGDWGVVGVG